MSIERTRKTELSADTLETISAKIVAEQKDIITVMKELDIDSRVNRASYIRNDLAILKGDDAVRDMIKCSQRSASDHFSHFFDNVLDRTVYSSRVIKKDMLDAIISKVELELERLKSTRDSKFGA